MKQRIGKLSKRLAIFSLIWLFTGCNAQMQQANAPALPAVQEIRWKYHTGVYDFPQAERALEDLARRQARLASLAEDALAAFRQENPAEYRASLESEAAAYLRAGEYARAMEILEILQALDDTG